MSPRAPTDASPTRRDAQCWQPGPRTPRLADGAVHVWRVDLGYVEEGVVELLNDEERERAARMLHERDRDIWGCSRGLLRSLLGGYLRREPTSLRFTEGARGKPALHDGSCTSLPGEGPSTGEPMRLDFNLSHSGAIALYAFSAAGEVGIDIESDHRELDEVALARRMLGTAESTRLEAIADPLDRRREFLRAWTRYEARLKCLGTGIGAEPSRDGEPLWLIDLDPAEDAAGALACVREPRELHCWSWH